MRNTLVKEFILLICISMISLLAVSQTVLFNESFGAPSATTAISAYAGWTNGVGLTFDQGGAANAADIRNSSGSSGYSGSSGTGNVFCTTASERGIGINGIQAAAYTDLSLSFGYRKESATLLPTLQLDFWDGTVWVNVPFSFSQAANATATWYLVSGINLPIAAQINGLKIRFVKTGTTTAVRLDDVKLQGNVLAPTALSVSNISSPQTQNTAFSVTVNSLNGAGSSLAVTQNTTVVLSTNGNAGNLVGTTSATITSGSSSVTFTGLTLDGSGSGVTITVTATTGNVLTSGTSNAFNVSSAAANDCAGVPGGSALPGTACDDNNACTINDVWSASCVCAGTIQDTDGDGTCDATDECDSDPNKILAGACGCGNIEVGQVCNDNNACTENDVITVCGVCAGTALLDTDNDGTCDLTDECDSDPNKILAGTCGCGNTEPTSACDDGNALTSGDAINGSCVCVGLYPVVYFNFTGATGSTPAAHTSSSITNLTPGTLTRGSNNGTTNATFGSTSASSGYSGASGTINAGVAARAGALDLTANSGSAYFEFSLDADQGYTLTITELTFGSRSTSTGPQSVALRSSADGYVADIATTSVANSGSWVLKSMPLTNFVTIAGANVTYRLYGYAGTGSPATNTTNWRIDDLNIYGYTTFAPPSSIVQFSSPTQTGQENYLSDTLTITMDVAPLSDVTVAISDLLTGTATAGVDYNYTPVSVTFSPADTYPSSKYVGFAIVNDTEVEPLETIAFGLSITSGTATLGTSTLTYSLSSDDLAQLVINEVDYDMNGSDNAEWIEIKNNGSTAVDINGYKLELVNGGNTPATVYTTITLATTATLLQPGGYYVAGNNATIANINLVVTPTTNLIQNGAPDAIGLKDNSNNLLDAVSYEGNTTSPYIEGTGVNTLVDAGSANFPSGTIGRFPDGADSDDNMADLITLCVGTPGASNTQVTSTFYLDFDADTYGNVDSTIAACEAPLGYVSNSTDCNDTSFMSNPAALEICDGLDNDCDNVNENGLTFNQYFADADADGAGYAPVAYYQSVANEYMNSNSIEQPIQTFNTGSTSVNGFVVTLPLGTCKQNGLTGAEVEIVTVLNGEPEVTNVLGSYSVPESAIIGAPGCVAGFYGKVDFNFSSLILQPNSQYGIVLKLNNPIGGAGIAWKRSSTPDDVSDPYPGGMIWNQMSMFPGNSNLMSNNNLDLNFEIFEISKYTYACSQPVSGFILGNLNNLDCNDLIASINPSAPEICDGLDNDCNGVTDNGLIFSNYYLDEDGDGYGSGTPINACQSPGGQFQVGDVGPSGGRIFYDKGNDQGGWRYMELSPSDLSSGAEWGCTNTFVGGTTTSVGSGFQNTLNMVQNCGDLNTAAHLCLDYSIGSYSDWFLPSQDEWALIYNNLQVPGIINFETGVGNQWNRYWTSTESWIYANAQDFTPYYQQIVEKNWMARVRAARRFAGYVINSSDCNDASSSAYPGGTEVCGNGIDDDCIGGDLSCPIGTFTTAVSVNNIGQFGTGAQATQSVNLSTGTNTVQSPGLGLDKWFSFTATGNAMRIAVTGSASVEDDNDLSLYETPTDPTVQLIPIVSENDVHPGSTGAAADGGSETLIYDQLVVGNVYYLCVRNNNNTAGNVSLTLSNLNPSTTDIALYTNGTNTYTSACQNFKVKFRPNSAGYTINRWTTNDVSGVPAWSYAIPVTSTVASTICQLGKVAPANLSGSSQTVYVTVDVLYNLTDAFGTVTPATARANAAASFQMSSEADLNVRATDRCAAGFKSTSSSIATNRSVCGTTRYVWEMSLMYPTTSLPLEVQGAVGGSRVLALNAVPALTSGQRYDVRIAAKHVDGVTQTAFGTTQCVKTIGAAGMPTIEEEVNMYERSENGITTTIYPNPNNGQSVNFSINGMDGSLNLKVTDATGREVYNNRFMVEGSMNTTLDFGQTLADGVYMVEMLQNGEMKTMRMVVRK